MENDPVDDQVDAILRNAQDQTVSGCRIVDVLMEYLDVNHGLKIRAFVQNVR